MVGAVKANVWFNVPVGAMVGRLPSFPPKANILFVTLSGAPSEDMERASSLHVEPSLHVERRRVCECVCVCVIKLNCETWEEAKSNASARCTPWLGQKRSFGFDQIKTTSQTTDMH
jgi:hypothetical protein